MKNYNFQDKKGKIRIMKVCNCQDNKGKIQHLEVTSVKIRRVKLNIWKVCDCQNKKGKIQMWDIIWRFLNTVFISRTKIWIFCSSTWWWSWYPPLPNAIRYGKRKISINIPRFELLMDAIERRAFFAIRNLLLRWALNRACYCRDAI